jgi:hypothetical protein
LRAAIPIILFLRTIFLRAIEGDEDRLSGMGDLVRYRLRDRLIDRKTDLLPLELTGDPGRPGDKVALVVASCDGPSVVRVVRAPSKIALKRQRVYFARTFF